MNGLEILVSILEEHPDDDDEIFQYVERLKAKCSEFLQNERKTFIAIANDSSFSLNDIFKGSSDTDDEEYSSEKLRRRFISTSERNDDVDD